MYKIFLSPQVRESLLSDLMDDYNICPFPLRTQEELQQEMTETLQILEKYKK